MHKCVYLPAQIGPLSVWSLLRLLLKDSSSVQKRVCVCVCTCMGELRCVPAGPQTNPLAILSLQLMWTKEEYLSL